MSTFEEEAEFIMQRLRAQHCRDNPEQYDLDPRRMVYVDKRNSCWEVTAELVDHYRQDDSLREAL